MGKKTRRPARQDKRTEKKPTLDSLDDDTAKPNEPLSAESCHATTYLQVNYKDQGIPSSQINPVEFREGVRASSTAHGLEYNRLVVINRMRPEGLYSALKAIEKWPRVQPYWKRVRRRICACCARQADLSEPRFLVCSECGDARYCSEQCQREDWYSGVHQKDCPAGRLG